MKKESAARWVAFGAACLFGATACQTTSATRPSLASDEPKGALEQETLGGAATPNSESSLQPVYFDYDRWDLREDAQRALRENAQKIQANPGWGTLTIEGHADERGSEEYNLALGERRAAKVERYLQDLGIPGSRLRSVSFGESRPAAQGHDEPAWRYNRRSEIHVDSRRASR
jgi:peptidoglycan-associated lipoprotein